MKNELRGFLNRIDWFTFVWMQDSWVLLKLDSIWWLKTLENNFMQWLVVNTLFQEMTKHHNQEDGSRETRELDLYWKLQPVTCMVNMESRLEFSLWAETILKWMLNVQTFGSVEWDGRLKQGEHKERRRTRTELRIGARQARQGRTFRSGRTLRRDESGKHRQARGDE